MLQLGQITALGTVVFTSILIVRHGTALLRLRGDDRGDAAGSQRTKAQSRSAIITQLLAWLAGVAAVYLVQWVGFKGAFSVGGKELSALPEPQKWLIGLMAASTLSTVNEIKKALDNTDSARVPSLLGNPIVPPKPGEMTAASSSAAAAGVPQVIKKPREGRTAESGAQHP
jgi:hypothetical protein